MMGSQMTDNDHALWKQGWNEALIAVCRLLEGEAAACLTDIKINDDEGKKLALARVNALLTAQCDVAKLRKE